MPGWGRGFLKKAAAQKGWIPINAQNERLLEIFLERVRSEYARDIALVFIYGSAARDEDGERSDLDLVFIPQTRRGHELASCFLIGETGYDFFPMTWERLERIASFEEQLTDVLAGGRVVYAASRDQAERFEQLQGWIMDMVDSPLSMPMLEKAEGLLDRAMVSAARMQLEKPLGRVREHAGGVLLHAAQAACMMNNRYLTGGMKDWRKVLSALRRLPEGFMDQYDAIVTASTVAELRRAAWAMLASTRALYLEQLAEKRTRKPSRELRGGYEECRCNWAGKIALAAKTGDASLAFLSGIFFQSYLDSVTAEYGFPPMDIMRHYDAKNLPAFLEGVEQVLADYRQELGEEGVAICEYPSAEAFQKAWMKR